MQANRQSVYSTYRLQYEKMMWKCDPPKQYYLSHFAHRNPLPDTNNVVMEYAILYDISLEEVQMTAPFGSDASHQHLNACSRYIFDSDTNWCCSSAERRCLLVLIKI